MKKPKKIYDEGMGETNRRFIQMALEELLTQEEPVIYGRDKTQGYAIPGSRVRARIKELLTDSMKWWGANDWPENAPPKPPQEPAA